MKTAMSRTAATILGLALAVWPISHGQAAELQIIAGAGIADPLTRIAEDFKHATGHDIAIRYGTATELIKLATGGDGFDLGVAPDDVWKNAEVRARIVPGSVSDIARVGIGVAVRTGATKPDISTVEAFRQTLLNARSVASIPGSSVGTLLSGLYDRLGVAAEMAARTKPQPGPGQLVEAVATGDAQLGIFTLSVLIDPRLDVVGPLPTALQRELVYAAALASHSKAPEAAQAFITYLKSPAVITLLKARGFSPG